MCVVRSLVLVDVSQIFSGMSKFLCKTSMHALVLLLIHKTLISDSGLQMHDHFEFWA